MTKDEALVLALEALGMAAELQADRLIDFKKYGLKRDKDIGVKYDEAITAIKQALAAPVQRCALCDYQYGHAIGCKNNPVDIALGKKAENARELGLDYEPAPMAHIVGEIDHAGKVWKPAQQEPVGDEWTPCMKLPIVVHVRQQRPGEAHVSTREGITPVKPDDLIMRGVSGEEYPIGRTIFEQTYALTTTPPAAPVQPVAWGIIASNTGRICQVEFDAAEVEGHNPKHIVPLYTTPPAQPARTLEELYALSREVSAEEAVQPAVPDAMYREGWNAAIEAAAGNFEIEDGHYYDEVRESILRNKK
jgi:hypothetical protein